MAAIVLCKMVQQMDGDKLIQVMLQSITFNRRINMDILVSNGGIGKHKDGSVIRDSL